MKKQDWWLRAIQRFPARTGGNVERVPSVEVDSKQGMSDQTLTANLLGSNELFNGM